MKHKVGKQRLGTRNGECSHRYLTRHHQEVTQERHVEGRNHQQLPFSDPGNLPGGLLQILVRSGRDDMLARSNLR